MHIPRRRLIPSAALLSAAGLAAALAGGAASGAQGTASATRTTSTKAGLKKATWGKGITVTYSGTTIRLRRFPDITSDIMPTTITGDMHVINKANFAILNWYGMKLAPRFTNLQAQRKHLFCGGDPADYEKFLIQPVGQIDRALIVSEKANIDQIVATLGLKEMTQSTLIRKLCALSQHNRTR